MTTPAERTRAVIRMGDLVFELCFRTAQGKGETARVPRRLLKQLSDALRHYPYQADIARSAEALPDVWGDPDGLSAPQFEGD